MPLALNLQVKKFTYGEFLQREGEVPKGLFLIKSGICRAAKNRILTRTVKAENVPGAKKPILDKNPLFNNFDHENTLLNVPKQQVKSYQHSRLYVTENGVQLKD